MSLSSKIQARINISLYPAKKGPAMLTQRFEMVRKSIEYAPVINTHDHIWPLSMFESPMNLMALFKNSYVARALRSSDGGSNGIPNRAAMSWGDSHWESVKSVIDKVKLTSYYRSLLRGLVELYDLPQNEITEASCEALSHKIETNYKNPLWLQQVLDRANIKAVIWDAYWKPGEWQSPEKRLLPSLRISSSMAAFHPDASDYEGTNLIRDWGAYFNQSVDSLQDLEVLMDKVIQKNVEAGARSLKSAIAYERSLAVGPGLREKASTVFGTPPERISPADRLAFGDYIIRYYLDQARQRDLVFQVHTGLARLNDSHPMLLTSLIEQYPGVVFDIFHGGYPWYQEVGALAQNYPNVRLNLVWLPQLSVEAAVRALKEWLQVTPQADRISWGADCFTMEEMFGALLTVKYVISRALADFIDDDYINIDTALETAQAILYHNAKKIYHLE
jgi:predicted TIM-barrel fold metal-dependent hydrolase